MQGRGCVLGETVVQGSRRLRETLGRGCTAGRDRGKDISL